MEVQIDQKHRKLHSLNRAISIILRMMTAVCLLLILTGLVMYIVTGAAHAVEITPLSQLLGGLFSFGPASFITLGLIVMLLMPPAILLASLAYFAAVKDSRPLIVCIVLVILLAASYILVFW